MLFSLGNSDGDVNRLLKPRIGFKKNNVVRGIRDLGSGAT